MNTLNNLAFVFPGQGSQSIGMLNSFLHEDIVKQTLEQANDILQQDIASLINNGKIEELSLTINTQPAILTASIALYRLWQQNTSILPKVLAGHSLGEYSALVVSQVISFEQALPLVRFRAQAMQQAVPSGIGGMAAIIGLSADIIDEICKKISASLTYGIVEAVNYNSSEQTVIAGNILAIEQACTQLKQKGAKRTLILPVSAPFHSSLLKLASEKLAIYLQNVKFQAPQIPIINNVNVKIESIEQNIKQALIEQVAKPVRWVEIIQTMLKEHNINEFVECGCGKVLQGLIKRIIPSTQNINIYSTDSLENFHSILQNINN